VKLNAIGFDAPMSCRTIGGHGNTITLTLPKFQNFGKVGDAEKALTGVHALLGLI